jgi:uncharacterized protein DUF4253
VVRFFLDTGIVPSLLGFEVKERSLPKEQSMPVLSVLKRLFSYLSFTQLSVCHLAPSNVEMRVLRPPTTWEEAFTLAKEQYIYAPDVVDQWLGGSLTALVKTLLNGHVWLFWWD